ncbi:MAG: 3-hydroxyacyl-CoA dehydrogenase [Chloroflexota bacterium]
MPQHGSSLSTDAPIALVGTGLVGRSWAVVFARAGHPVALHDAAPDAAAAAVAWARATLESLHDAGLLAEAPATVAGRLRVATSLEDVVRDATLVQESTREVLEAKQALMAELDRLADPSAIVASSTSTIPASRFSADLPGRARCLVAHPVNPPHLVPLVELSPAPWTDPAVVERARALFASVGQVPVVLRAEVDGFLLNRLQVALLQEAYRLYADGYASAEDIDRTVRDGLGLRWSFMGPFETIDLNAAGGLADFVHHLGPVFDAIAATQLPRPWSPEMVARLDAERRAELPLADLPARQAWRDRRLALLRAHRAEAEGRKPGSD